MNKKIIYLSVFLVLALFIISACQIEPIGKATPGGGGGIKTKFVDYTFEVSDAMDLTSDPKLPGFGTANTVHIWSSKDNAIKLPKKYFNNITNDKNTNDIWFTVVMNRDEPRLQYGGLYVFYVDKTFKKKAFAGNFSGTYIGQKFYLLDNNANFGHDFNVIKFNLDNIGVKYPSPQKETRVYARFTTTGDYRGYKLGSYRALEEKSEMGGGVEGSGSFDGLTNKDFITRFLKVRNPKENGASDRVSISIATLPPAN